MSYRAGILSQLINGSQSGHVARLLIWEYPEGNNCH
jgi:hypothetical protein